MFDYIINFYKDGKLEYISYMNDYYDNVIDFAMIRCAVLGASYSFAIMLD